MFALLSARNAVAKGDTTEFNVACDLGKELFQAGHFARAVDQFRIASRLRPDSPAAQFGLGRALARMDRHAEAEPALRRALEIRRKDPKCAVLLSRTLKFQNRAEEAIEVLRAAIADQDDDSWDINYELGVTLRLAGRPAEAAPFYEAALKEKPTHVETLIGFGRSLAMTGRAPEALDVYRLAVEAAPKRAEALFLFGKSLAGARRAKEGIKYLKAAIIARPKHVPTLLAMGRAYLAIGKPSDAVTTLTRAMALEPANERVLEGLRKAQTSLEAKSLPAAKSTDNVNDADARRSTAILQLLTSQLANGRQVETERLVETIELRDIVRVDQQLLMGRLLLVIGRDDKARIFLSKAFAANPRRAELCKPLVIALVRSGDWLEMAGALGRFAGQNASQKSGSEDADRTISQRLALTAIDSAEHQKALLERTLDDVLNDDVLAFDGAGHRFALEADMGALRVAARSGVDSGVLARFVEALVVDYISMSPADDDYVVRHRYLTDKSLLAYAYALVRDGRTADALRELDGKLSAPEFAADVLRLRLDACIKNGEFETALGLLRELVDKGAADADSCLRVVDIAPSPVAACETLTLYEHFVEDPETLAAYCNRIAGLAVEAKNAPLSAKLYLRSLMLKPFAREASVGMAEFLLAAKRHEDAINLLQQALKRNQSKDLHLALFKGLICADDVPGARDAFRAVHDGKFDELKFLTRAGALSRLYLMYGESERYFAQALEKDPDNSALMTELGRTLMRLKRPEQALSHFKAAAANRPGNIDAKHGAGAALRQLGRPEEAAEALSEIVAAAPRRHNSWIELAGAQETLGAFDAAFASYSGALRADPSNAPARLALARLEYERGDVEAAVRHCNEVLQRYPADKKANMFAGWMKSARSHTVALSSVSILFFRSPSEADRSLATEYEALGCQVVFLGANEETGRAAVDWVIAIDRVRTDAFLSIEGAPPSAEHVEATVRRLGSRTGAVVDGASGAVLWRTELWKTNLERLFKLSWTGAAAAMLPRLRLRSATPPSPETLPEEWGKKTTSVVWLVSSSGVKLFGGVEHFLRSMAQLYERLGYEPVIVGLLESMQDVEQDGVRDGFRFKNIERNIDKFRKAILEQNPDIIHATTGIGYDVAAAARHLRARVVYGTHFWRDMFHGHGSYLDIDRLGVPMKRFSELCASVDQAYANSLYTQDAIEAHFNVAQPILYSLPYDAPPLAPDRQPGRSVLLMNARPEKGFNLVLQIAPLCPNVTFTVVASQSSKARVEDAIRQHGVTNIEALEWIEDTAAAFRSALAVVVPSYSFVETFSRVVIEAQRQGAPTIGSDRGNVRLLLDDLGLALPEDAEIWAAEINRLASDPDHWRMRSDQARDNADKYTFADQFGRLKKIVSGACGRVAVGVGSGIGNILQATPAIRRLSEHLGRPVDILLRQDFPGCSALLMGSEYVNSVIVSDEDMTSTAFDLVYLLDCFGQLIPKLDADAVLASRRKFSFDMTRTMHEAEFNLMCMQEQLGVPYEPDDVGKYFVAGFERGDVKPRRIGFHGGSKAGVWAAKQWSGFVDLARRLQEDGYEVASFGGPSELVPGTLDLTGLPLRDSILGISQCEAFIANDSGLMHVADALKVPLVSIFGPSSVVKNRPLSKSSAVVAVEKDCAPCQFEMQRLATCRCIHEIGSHRVREALRIVLDPASRDMSVDNAMAS